MPDDLDIQHAAPGFEADGRPVPMAEPNIYFDDPVPVEADTLGGMDLVSFINAMMQGTTSLEQIGARVVLTAFAQPKCFYRPKSLRELADWLDCSHPTAKKKFTTFLSDFAGDSDV